MFKGPDKTINQMSQNITTMAVLETDLKFFFSLGWPGSKHCGELHVYLCVPLDSSSIKCWSISTSWHDLLLFHGKKNQV